MFKNIIKVLDTTNKKINDFGIQITLPKPSKRSFKVTAVTNGTIGSGLIIFGVLSSSKWAIVLGALGVLWAICIVTFD
ncbi:hypothetical protein [Metaclostridioides mangenotii]|uniref:hypothetical protein n=1 Tax=Metaclostridioides mangenotii TaxID=1540 RepID=UPI0004B7D55B|nr:hypothetical protein [Clostridioides mangenotii]